MSEKKVTQIELAKAIGVDRPTISNWCRDEFIPSNTNRQKLADFFNVSPTNFTQTINGEAVIEFNLGVTIKRMAAVADVSLLAIAEILAKLNNRTVIAEVGDLEELVTKRINGEELNKLVVQVLVQE